MQTTFTPEQLRDPHIAESPTRSCANACIAASAPRPARPMCCSAMSSIRRAGASISSRTCWSAAKPATAETVKHIDRCLSCLSCMTTCPSGVHYMHLIDDARVHVEKTYQRPLAERMLARAARLRHAAARTFPLGACCGTAWPAVRAALRQAGRQACRSPARPRAESTAAAGDARPARHLSGGRQTARSRRAAAGLRAKRARSRHQRRRHPPPEPPWRRSRGHGGRSLLRLAHPSHGQGGGCPGPRPAHGRSSGRTQMSMPSSSRRRAAARRSRTMAIMLRLDPLYAEKAAAISQEACDITEFLAETRSARSRSRRGRCTSPIIRPARCSMARRSTASRRRCSPRRASR